MARSLNKFLLMKELFRSRISKVTGAIVVLLLAIWGGADMALRFLSSGRVYEFSELGCVPKKRAAVVLGCAKKVHGGLVNLYYARRIDAAAALYRSGRVDCLIVSGDNHVKGYDEPSDMKASLVAEGIPSDKIVCDYAGFRTLDSVVRAKEVFGLDSFIVVSQPEHLRRAVFLARCFGCDAVGYAAEDVEGRHSVRTTMREQVAKCLAVFDVLIRRRPKFYGPREKLPDSTTKNEYPWMRWKDPLSEPELKKIMSDEGRIRKELGAVSERSLEPTVSAVSLMSPQSFLGLTFGEPGPVSTKSNCLTVVDVLKEFQPVAVLEDAYFGMKRVEMTRSRSSHRLAKLQLRYNDYDGIRGPLGRYCSGKALLEETRKIRADIERRLGVPLQELRLYRQNWPYHPGIKMSQCWGGSIPDKYLCSEAEWIEARHAFAYSRTVSGDYRIEIIARQIYYDERSVAIVITDWKEMQRLEKEFADAFLRKHKPEEGRVFGVGSAKMYWSE